MNANSIKKNAFLISLKTLISLFIPLFSFPYISRVLQVAELGKFNFSNSIVSYFIMISGLGISTYAIREGAKIRNDRKAFNKLYSELYILNAISSGISILLLFVFILFIPKLYSYRLIIILLAIQIVFNLYGRNWIYNVFEEFAFISFLHITINILMVIFIYLFVKSPRDIIIYTIIYVISSTGSNMICGIKIRKYADLHKIKLTDLKKHIKPVMYIFFTSIATTIYSDSDITLLGWLIGDECVGLYSISTKVYIMIKQVIVAIITVSIPRLTLYSGKSEFKIFFKKIFNTLLIIIVPTMIGLIMTASDIILIISGEEYIEATLSLQILSVALIFALIAGLFGMGVLLPYNKEKILLLSTTLSAIINIILNVILIPFFQIDAAAITTVFSQLIAMLICWWFSRKEIEKILDIKSLFSIIIGSIIIIYNCIIIKNMVSDFYLSFFLKVFISIILYGITLLFLKNEYVKALFIEVKDKLIKN